MKWKVYNRLKLLLAMCAVLAAVSFVKETGRANDGSLSVEQNSIDSDCYENIIAITFDDGPCAKTTTKLLDGLAQRGVKATFFLVGKNVEGNEAIVKRMHEEGHLIGNHTYSHIDLSRMKATAKSEIIKANEVIQKITGEEVLYIRPPYGKYDSQLIYGVNMTPVLWSVDPDDWNTANVTRVVNSVVSHVQCGDIILLHDIYDSSVTAALEIIDRLQDKGYVFVTVDQLLLD